MPASCRRLTAVLNSSTEPAGRKRGSGAKSPSVGVEQQFVGVEPVAGSGFVGAVNPIAVELAGARLGQIAVPHLIGVFRQRDARLFVLSRAVEEAQLDPIGMRREQREIDPL